MLEKNIFPVFVTLFQEIVVFLRRKYQISEDNSEYR